VKTGDWSRVGWALFARLTRLPKGPLGTKLLEYIPAIIGGALWGYTAVPSGARNTAGVFRWIFKGYAPYYDRDWAQRHDYGHSLSSALDGIEPPRRVLDLAAGSGFAARLIGRRFPSAEVIGVDISPEMVALARDHAEREGLNVRFEVGDIAHLGFESGSFDLIVQQNSFPFLDEMLRLLRPGGTALLVFSYGGPWAQLAWPKVRAKLADLGTESIEALRTHPGFFGRAVKAGAQQQGGNR
jgi:SAM-dependent methyltransferase